MKELQSFGHGTEKDQGIFFIEAHFHHLFLCHRGIRKAKNSLHACRLRAVAYQPLVCARAQSKAQRIDDNGLTGAGFTAQNVEFYAKIDRAILNECDIFDVEL